MENQIRYHAASLVLGERKLMSASHGVSVVVLWKKATSWAQTHALLDKIQAHALVKEVLVAGEVDPVGRQQLRQKGIRTISVTGGRGIAIQAALGEIKNELIILQDSHFEYSPSNYHRLVEPIISKNAEAVFAIRKNQEQQIPKRAIINRTVVCGVSWLRNAIAKFTFFDWETGLMAFRTGVIRKLELRSAGEEVDAEIIMQLAKQSVPTAQMEVTYAGEWKECLSAELKKTFQVLRCAVRPAVNRKQADAPHEGYTTLQRLEEGAPRYNAWLGHKFSQYLGKRVLEVGAGIGTITQQIANGRELVVALEMEQFYYQKLKSIFAQIPQVIPHLSGVEEADWLQLKEYQFDSALLSNVLEHIADDCQALINIRSVLPSGGRLVILVPAGPWLFGSLDQAVGHFRRYTRNGLRELLQDSGFIVEHLESMNMLGIPGWLVNGRILQRRALPALQLRGYNWVAPLVVEIEKRFPPPTGMSILAVARVG